MPEDVDSDETTVFATYGTRRDAEVASEYLADAGIRSFVSSDDAGGMYPQMQRPNGVKLIGMAEAGPDARARLEEAGLRPDPSASTADTMASTLGPALYGISIVLGLMAVLLVLLMVVLG